MSTQGSKLFPGQNDHEEILIFVRRHWMPFVFWLFFIGVMLLIPVVILIALIFVDAPRFFAGFNLVYLALGIGAYLLFVNAIFLTAWIEHYLEVAIITPDRLVYVKQIGLFNRRLAELSMANVQDVSAQMHGYLQSILQFGTVIVETATGGAPDFIIHNVSKPHVVANTILMIHDKQRLKQTVEVVEQQDTIHKPTPMFSAKIQETIVRQTPSIAPPRDYQRQHLREDLLTQAIDAKEQDADHSQSAPTVVPVVTSQPPNRLPTKRSAVSRVEGELVEGQDISID